MSEDTLFWIFSTISQSFVTLVSLIGMVCIYKIQNISDNRNAILESAKIPIAQLKRENFELLSRDEIKGFIYDELTDFEKKNQDDSHYKPLIKAKLFFNSKLLQLDNKESEIKTQAKFFFITTTFLVGYSLAGLATVDNVIIKYNLSYLAVLIAFLFCGYTLYSSARLLIRLI